MINEMRLDKSVKLSGEQLDGVVAGSAASNNQREAQVSRKDIEIMRRALLEYRHIECNSFFCIHLTHWEPKERTF